ncbi:MAG: ATP-binding protein [Corynebacterium glutamicum]|nr:ATP-binding protein [Corynebacterium glutamicum]
MSEESIDPLTYDEGMKTLPITAENDHVQSLSGRNQSEKALIELVWNAIDAEADNIEIAIERSESNAIEKVIVKDDGHGFNHNDVDADFARIGGSWKATKSKTINDKRSLHGRKGKGRLRGFALGGTIYWESIAQSVEGRFEKTTVKGHFSDTGSIQTTFEIISSEKESFGTKFTAENTEQWQLAPLDNGKAVDELLVNFSPILLAEENLSIIFDGKALVPKENIADDVTREFSYEDKTGKLRIIRWKAGQESSILFGPDDDHFLAEIPGNEFGSGFPFTAYVISEEITADSTADITIGNIPDSSLNALWAAAKREFSRYSIDFAKTKRVEKFKRWKSNGSYPYKDNPKTKAEEAERATFDVVATTISEHIPKNKTTEKLTLQLLKTAIQNEPDDLGQILMEVVNLSEEDRGTLTDLLQETTLPAIIASANKVAQRSKFLAALETMLFDPANSKKVKERDHLHKILENELWVFGEEYSVMRSERGLNDLLKIHLQLEGIEETISHPVRRWDGKTGRTDLHLAVKGKEFGLSRHLIVELKAPDITATRKELNQLEDYANVIASEPGFSVRSSTWDLVLLVTKMDELASNRVTDEKTGLLQDITRPGKPRIRTFIREWADVIEENRQRLSFYSDTLEHDPSADEGMDYVRQNYTDYLPKELITNDEDAA